MLQQRSSNNGLVSLITSLISYCPTRKSYGAKYMKYGLNAFLKAFCRMKMRQWTSFPSSSISFPFWTINKNISIFITICQCLSEQPKMHLNFKVRKDSTPFQPGRVLGYRHSDNVFDIHLQININIYYIFWTNNYLIFPNRMENKNTF